MRGTRVILFLSPLLLLLALEAPPGYRWFAYPILSLVICLLVGFSAKRGGRDDAWWWWCAYFFPFVTPIVLALLPDKWNAPRAELRRAFSAAGGAAAKAATGAFEDRFPLLVESASGQAAETQAGLTARFRTVKANLEFTVAVVQDTAARLLLEARKLGFEMATGEQGALILVYGAGLVPPNKVDQLAAWLTGAAAPGQRMRMAFRDAEGFLNFIEHRPEEAAGLGAGGQPSGRAHRPEAARGRAISEETKPH